MTATVVDPRPNAAECLRARQHVLHRRVLATLLAVHIPVLAGFALWGPLGGEHWAAHLAPVLLLSWLAWLLQRHPAGPFVVTLGLMTCSATLVHLSGGSIEAHFHFFAMLGFVALFRDWKPYALAVGFVVLHHGVLGVLMPGAVYNHPAAIANPWLWAGVHGGLVLLASCGIMLFWRMNDDAHKAVASLWEERYEQQRELATELQRTEQLKTELLQVVSHEFKTPLTCILGFAQTLKARAPEDIDGLVTEGLDVIERQAERLTRLVDHVLGATAPIVSSGGSCDVGAVAARVCRQLAADPAMVGKRLEWEATPGLWWQLDEDSTEQVLLNLVDNAVKHGIPDTSVHLRVTSTAGAVRLTVANSAALGDSDLERFFLPFERGQSELSGPDGWGLGLHIVRKLVTSAGGDIVGEVDAGEVTFTAQVPDPVGSSTAVPAPVAARR